MIILGLMAVLVLVSLGASLLLLRSKKPVRRTLASDGRNGDPLQQNSQVQQATAKA